MSARDSLIPTAVAVGYGAAPAAAPKKRNGISTSLRVLVAVAGVAGVCGLAVGGGGYDLFASLGSSKHDSATANKAHHKSLDSLSEMTKKYGDVRSALAQSHKDAIVAMRHMQVRPMANTPGAKPRLGASEYENCVAKGSRASEAYERNFGNATDAEKEIEIKKDLTFAVNRADMPAITAYNDSKALLMQVGCEVPPPPRFKNCSCVWTTTPRLSATNRAACPCPRTATRRAARASGPARPRLLLCATRSAKRGRSAWS